MALNLVGTVSLDGSGFERGLGRIGSSLKSFVGTAFGIYGVQQALQKTFETASRIVDMSQRLGIGAEQLQILDRAAKNSSTNIESLAAALEKMWLARRKALEGGKEGQAALEAFRALGVSREQLQTTTREDLFMGPISKAIRAVNPADLTKELRELFGRGFGDVVNVAQTNFDELGGTMRRLGLLMDGKTAASLDELGDRFSMLTTLLTIQLGPAILSLVETIYKASAGISATWSYLKEKFSQERERMGATFAAGMSYGRVTPEQQKAIAGRSQEDVKRLETEAKQAGISAFDRFMKPFNEMKAEWEKLAKRIERPIGPELDIEPPESKAKKVRIAKDSGGDALVRVGNFLSSSRDALANIAQQQLNVLKVIAHNTKPQSESFGGLMFPF